jgi:hypothetical protein
MMRRAFILSLSAGLILLSGCVRHYVITLNNGSQIGTTSKPKLKGGFYVFKDGAGRESHVSAGRISEIAPSSMVEDKGGPFKPTPSR